MDGGHTKNQITIDGVLYLSAAKVADMFGLTRDYVARLARSGKVKGRQVKRVWYVEARAFEAFFLEQLYINEKRRQELAYSRTHEYKAHREPARRGAPRRSIKNFNHGLITPKSHVSDVLAQTLVRSGVHTLPGRSEIQTMPLYAVSPAMDFLHRVTALFAALLLVFGMYAFWDTDYARYVYGSLNNTLKGASQFAAVVSSIDYGEIISTVKSECAQALQVLAQPF